MVYSFLLINIVAQRQLAPLLTLRQSIDGRVFATVVSLLRKVVAANNLTGLACVRWFLLFCHSYLTIKTPRILETYTAEGIVLHTRPGDSSLQYWGRLDGFLSSSGYGIPGAGRKMIFEESKIATILFYGNERVGHYFSILVDLQRGRVL
jgi:hypothetical protein